LVRLVFSIIFLIVLAVFITFNAQYTTSINLFSYKMETVPVVAVVLLTLVAGVLYSFGLYLITYFSKMRVGKEKNLKRKNQEKAKELKEQEKEMKFARDTLEHPENALPPAEDLSAGVSGTAPANAPAARIKGKRKLFKK
jgi:uncharacterized integral membrane protein